jgi:hypothetical protein
MSEKDIQNLIELAESKIQAGVTKEEALETLVGAGIVDENGDYTEPYKDLLDQAGIDA